MKNKLILLSVILCVVFGASNVYGYESDLRPFPDVESGDWAEEYIYTLSALRIVEGYPDRTFHPEEKLSREAFVTMLVGAAGLDVSASRQQSFSDVEPDWWSFPYIQTANEHSFIDFLIDDHRFLPQQEITREQVAAMLGKYLLSLADDSVESKWLSTDWKKQQAETVLVDADQINTELAPYVYYAVHEKVMVGDVDLKFRPLDTLSRKEAAAVIYSLLDNQLAEAKLDVAGFYAIRSYPNIDKISMMDQLIVGWSELDYVREGSATASLNKGTYKLPEGWEEVAHQAERHQVPGQLMVFAAASTHRLVDFLHDEKAQAAFIESLKQTLNDEKYRFSGVCIDFEELKDESLEASFTGFLQKLNNSIGSKTLTVAVPPTMYYKAYDQKRIGEIADYVVVMAHDFTHEASRLPSAPLPLVNETLTEALKYIPAEKIILGISKQANQWIELNGKISYEEPSVEQVEERLKQPGTTETFSNPYLLNKITYADEKGNHEIWYEGEQSILKKIWLAKHYGLHGISLWHMGRFTAEDYKAIASAKE